MGLRVDVYRHGRTDCTNGGVSGAHDTVTVVNIDGPALPIAQYPAVLLTEHVGNKILVAADLIGESLECKHCSELVASTVTDGTGRAELPEVWYHVEGNATSCAQNQIVCGRAPIAAAGDHVAEPAYGQTVEWKERRIEGSVGPMAGGNYAMSHDGRWSRAVGVYAAIPIHDRYETAEQYALLSSD